MKDADGKTYVIEVNGNPGTKIINTTGHNYFVDLVKHIEGKLDKRSSKSDEKEASAAASVQKAANVQKVAASKPDESDEEGSLAYLKKRYKGMF